MNVENSTGSGPFSTSPEIAARAGAGLKPEHVEEILATSADIGFFEVHAENYMGAGGVPHHQLGRIRDKYPLSLHGVGLSIGGENPLDKDHLHRLADLNKRYQPGLFSEHLAWSSHDGIYLNDLLPAPYNKATLDRVCDHIDQVQEVVGRQMLLENPSTYVSFEQTTMSEIEFISSVVVRTGCGLLLDVNNIYVSATNHEFSHDAYVDEFPMEHVQEIHLAGHAPDEDEAGRPLLIDAHDRRVADIVWKLYDRTIARSGSLPTLIEWDNDIPAWSVLMSEALIAENIMANISGNAVHAEAG